MIRSLKNIKNEFNISQIMKCKISKKSKLNILIFFFFIKIHSSIWNKANIPIICFFKIEDFKLGH